MKILLQVIAFTATLAITMVLQTAMSVRALAQAPYRPLPKPYIMNMHAPQQADAYCYAVQRSTVPPYAVPAYAAAAIQHGRPAPDPANDRSCSVEQRPASYFEQLCLRGCRSYRHRDVQRKVGQFHRSDPVQLLYFRRFHELARPKAVLRMHGTQWVGWRGSRGFWFHSAMPEPARQHEHFQFVRSGPGGGLSRSGTGQRNDKGIVSNTG